MIIRKLVEHAFKRLWLLAIPIVVAPALVLYISSQQPERYVSTASVWASDPRGIDATSLDNFSSRSSPASRLRTVLRDLLATHSFRSAVALEAGMLPTTELALADTAQLEQAANKVGERTSIQSRGTFIVSLTARASNARDAQALLEAVISQYQARNELEITRQADFANSYFSQQLEIAQRELDTRQALRDAYLVLNPEATDPTVNALNFNNYRSLDRRVTVQENIAVYRL